MAYIKIKKVYKIFSYLQICESIRKVEIILNED